MGRQTIWDGRGLPEIGDEVLFDTASSGVCRGFVDRFEVVRKNPSQCKNDSYAWRIEVHMTCRWAGIEAYPMMRSLEEVFSLTNQILIKAEK